MNLVSGNRKLLAIFSADWHVRNRDRIWAGYSDITGDTSYALQQFAELVEQLRPPYVFLGGDQMHVKLQQSDAIQMFRRTLQRLYATGTVTLFIQGNHDWAEPNLVNALHDSPLHIHGELHKLSTQKGHLTIYGLDFVPDEQAPDAIKQVPPCDILLTHQKWTDWGGGGYGVVSMKDVPSCRLILNGDYHVNVALQNEKLSAISPGPLCIQRTDESPFKCVYLIYDDLTFEAVPLKGRWLSHIEITSEEHLNQLLASPEFVASLNNRQTDVPENIAKQVIVVKYLSSIPRLRARLLAAAQGNCHLMFDPQYVQAELNETSLPIVSDLTLVQAVPMCCSDPEIAAAAVRVAQSDNPAAMIDTLYEEWLR